MRFEIRAIKKTGAIILIILLVACSSKQSNSPQEGKTTSSFSNLSKVLHSHPEIRSPFLLSYLKKLNEKLYISAKQLRKTADLTVPETRLLESKQALAMAIFPNTLVISDSLIRLTDSEAEFAFVIAHEMAHHFLKHSHETSLSPSLQQQYELQADELALSILVNAGWNPLASLDAIKRFSHLFPYTEATFSDKSHYPSVNERLSQIAEKLKVTPQIGNFTSSEYRQVKHYLSQIKRM